MPTKRFPRLPEPPNQAPMWQDEENDPYQGIVSHRGYDMHTMREFPAPFDTDPGLSGEGDDLPGLQDPGFVGDVPVVEDVRMQQRDPRIDAIEQMSRQGQVQRPGMKGEDDLDAFERQNQLENTRDRLKAPPRRTLGDMMGMPYGGQGTPDETAEAEATAKMTDEDLLAQVQKQIGRPGGNTVNPQDDDTNALAPFTGDYTTDMKILNDALSDPKQDYNKLQEMFNELHGEDMDDREMMAPPEEMRR